MSNVGFAKIYDEFMQEVDYKTWTDELEQYFIEETKIVADYGCGTGEISIQLLDRGYDVYSVDYSDEMLEVAKNKDSRLKLYKGDIRNYNFDFKVDAIISTFDTVNYFDSYEELEKFIDSCHSQLNIKGRLIFDIVTNEVFEEIFDDGLFIEDKENYTSIWRYETSDDEKYDVDIVSFVKDGDTYKKYTEQYTKMIFDVEEIVNYSYNNGYNILEIKSLFDKNRILIALEKK